MKNKKIKATMDTTSKEHVQRKQKRLGPAPIASFEVSFDDSTNNEVRSNKVCISMFYLFSQLFVLVFSFALTQNSSFE